MKLLELTNENDLNTNLTSTLKKVDDGVWRYRFYWVNNCIYFFDSPTPQVASMRLHDTHLEKIKSALIEHLKILKVEATLN